LHVRCLEEVPKILSQMVLKEGVDLQWDPNPQNITTNKTNPRKNKKVKNKC